MKNWKSILLLGLVFFAGLAVGVVGTRTAVRQFVQQAIAQPERIQPLVERDLTRRLRLDAEQQEKLRGILTGTRGQLRALRQEYQPQAVVILQGADAQITALLTPEQRLRYERVKQSARPFWRTQRPGP